VVFAIFLAQVRLLQRCQRNKVQRFALRCYVLQQHL
jgi:hypothetical protein